MRDLVLIAWFACILIPLSRPGFLPDGCYQPSQERRLSKGPGDRHPSFRRKLIAVILSWASTVTQIRPSSCTQTT